MKTMTHFRSFLGGILLVISLLLVPQTSAQGTAGDNDCSGSGDVNFECTNQDSISCDLVNDGINDCGDNSDEGYLYDCDQRGTDFQFKCTMPDQTDYGLAFCHAIITDHDDFPDCPDRSDEQKILGDTCLGTTEDLSDDIGCYYFMAESFCNSSNQCECDPGHKSINRESGCQLRVRGDTCDTQTDCSDAYYGLFCNSTSFCECTTGFYVDEADETVCVANRLFENCTIDLECSNPIDNAECDSDLLVCVCNELYIANLTTNYSCPVRVLGDECSADHQCETEMENVECSSGVCACKSGSYANDEGDNCIQTLVGEACSSDAACALVRYGDCSDSTGLCDCEDSEYLVDYMNLDCSLGVGDLFCDSDANCTAQISDSFCDGSVCVCDYGFYARTHKRCKKRILGSQSCRNNTDCSVAIDNAVCKTGSCQCASGYAPDPTTNNGKKCITDKEAACQDFACQYPWAVALLVLGLLAIAAVIVVLIIKKPWRKKTESEKSKIKPTTVAPLSNGGPIDIETAKPLWTLRPKSGIPMMYGNDARMQEAKDPETDAFYNGGPPPTPPVHHTLHEGRIKSGLRKVRFEGGRLPFTPEYDATTGTQTPGEVNILVIERPDDEMLVNNDDVNDLSELDDEVVNEDDDGGKKKKKKKDKKDKKKKDKKKKKKK